MIPSDCFKILSSVDTEMSYLSEQDKKDILFAKEVNADFLAISFVNSAQDVIDVKKYLKEISYSFPSFKRIFVSLVKILGRFL